MVIIRLWGGLGNQMFQYALYMSFLNKGIAAKLDRSFYDKHHEHNGYELENIFKVSPSYASYLNRLAVKLPGKLLYKLFNRPYKETDEMTGCFQPEVASLKSGYLKGYWQTEKYFSAIKPEVKKQFVFPQLTDTANLAMLDKILHSESVSIHIRRGDFLEKDRNWAISTEYYSKAIRFIKEGTTDPAFFIFSDDSEWVRKNIAVENASYIDWNKKNDSYKDMQLMSNCKHNIIANSSFSWWGAWLNDHRDKIVVAPDNWFPTMKGTRDIIPDTWIKITS